MDSVRGTGGVEDLGKRRGEGRVREERTGRKERLPEVRGHGEDLEDGIEMGQTGKWVWGRMRGKNKTPKKVIIEGDENV